MWIHVLLFVTGNKRENNIAKYYVAPIQNMHWTEIWNTTYKICSIQHCQITLANKKAKTIRTIYVSMCTYISCSKFTMNPRKQNLKWAGSIFCDLSLTMSEVIRIFGYKIDICSITLLSMNISSRMNIFDIHIIASYNSTTFRISWYIYHIYIG